MLLGPQRNYMPDKSHTCHYHCHHHKRSNRPKSLMITKTNIVFGHYHRESEGTASSHKKKIPTETATEMVSS